MVLTPQQKADKWATNIVSSVATTIANVTSTVNNPATAALLKRADMITNYTAALQVGGVWETRMQAVSADIELWRQPTLTALGQLSITNAQKNKVKDHYTKQDAILAKLNAMIVIIDDPVQTPNAPAGFGVIAKRFAVNTAIQANIDIIDETATASVILGVISPYLQTNFGFTP